MAQKKKKKVATKKPTPVKRKPVQARKSGRTTRKPKKALKPVRKRAVQRRSVSKRGKASTKGSKKKAVAKTKKQTRGRAVIVRRRNKAGQIYYFNKKTAKFSKKSKWYQYRTYAVKHKPKKEIQVKEKKEKEKLLVIDSQLSLIKIDLDKASDSELREEVNRLILEQMRWVDRLSRLKRKKNKRQVHNLLSRYGRAINKIKLLLNEYKQPKGFDEDSYNLGNTRVDNVYRWEVKKLLDKVLESERFEIYLVQGVSFMAEHEIDIHLAVDDLIIDAEMNDIYYLKFTRNRKTKVVHITLNY